MRCAIYGCNSNNQKKYNDGETTFHGFPTKDRTICIQWMFLRRRNDKFNVKTSRICSKHFTSDNFFPVNQVFKSHQVPIAFIINDKNGRFAM